MFSALEAVVTVGLLLLSLEVRRLCFDAEVAVGLTEKARVDCSVETQLNQARDVTTFISSVQLLQSIEMWIDANTSEKVRTRGEGLGLILATFFNCLGLILLGEVLHELTRNGRWAVERANIKIAKSTREKAEKILNRIFPVT